VEREISCMPCESLSRFILREFYQVNVIGGPKSVASCTGV
jgi:hypothetical protein